MSVAEFTLPTPSNNNQLKQGMSAMNIYPPDSIDESKYEHLNQTDFKKIFCTYLTFNKTTLEWYGGETTLNRHLNGYAGSGPSIIEHLKDWKKRLGENWQGNFICILDECFETKAEAKSRESELVNNDTRDELCINYLNGGGGWDYGEEIPEDVRIKYKKRYKGINNGMYGKKHTKESKHVMRDKKVGKKLTKSHKKNISKSISGKNHPFYKKQRHDDIKLKISQSEKGKIISDDTKIKMSIAKLGVKQSNLQIENRVKSLLNKPVLYCKFDCGKKIQI